MLTVNGKTYTDATWKTLLWRDKTAPSERRSSKQSATGERKILSLALAGGEDRYAGDAARFYRALRDMPPGAVGVRHGDTKIILVKKQGRASGAHAWRAFSKGVLKGKPAFKITG